MAWKSSATGRAAFLALHSGVAIFHSFNNEQTNYGDATNNPGSPTYAQADTSVYPDYGLGIQTAPSNNDYMDLYVPTDVVFLLYIPPTIATGTYGLFHNGGGTNGQGAFLRSQSNGTTVELGITHNASGSNQDYDTVTITERGWVCVGFQYEDNSGGMAIWVNGTEVSTISRTYNMLLGSGNPYIGGENLDDIPGWGVGANINGSGLLIANFVYDNLNNDNSAPVTGRGDSFYTDFYNSFYQVSAVTINPTGSTSTSSSDTAQLTTSWQPMTVNPVGSDSASSSDTAQLTVSWLPTTVTPTGSASASTVDTAQLTVTNPPVTINPSGSSSASTSDIAQLTIGSLGPQAAIYIGDTLLTALVLGDLPAVNAYLGDTPVYES